MEVVRVESGPSDTQGRIAATADADADSSDLENKTKRQGLGYSGDSTAKVLTKFCTPNGSPKKFWPCIKIFLASQAFRPCMTLWVKN